MLFVDPLEEHVAAINRDGLQLRGVHGHHSLRVPAVRSVDAVSWKDDDVVVCSVKSYQTDAAMQALRQATVRELPIFCAQNGVRNEEMAARYFRAVHGVMVMIGAKRLVPGEVVHTSAGPLGVGTWPSGLSEIARDVAQAIAKTDIPSYTTEEIAVHKWNKMAVNLNNATFGLIGLSGQEAQADPEVRAWLADVYDEGVRVLRAAGIRFEGPPGLGSIEKRIQRPSRARAGHRRADRGGAEAPAVALAGPLSRRRPGRGGLVQRRDRAAGPRRTACPRRTAGSCWSSSPRWPGCGSARGATPCASCARAWRDRRRRGATEPSPREDWPPARRAWVRCSRSSGRRSSSSSARWRASTS